MRPGGSSATCPILGGVRARRARPSHLLQEAQLLQLPLVVQDETVAPWPPARQVLLTPDVGHGRVQHPPAPPLHPWSDTVKTQP